MLAHKVFVTASAFHGQQLLQPLAARHTLSLPYAIFSSNAAAGDCAQLHVATLAPLVYGIS